MPHRNVSKPKQEHIERENKELNDDYVFFNLRVRWGNPKGVLLNLTLRYKVVALSTLNSLIYLVKTILESKKFDTKVAFNAQEARDLVAVGFEYVTGRYNDGGKIFRKKW